MNIGGIIQNTKKNISQINFLKNGTFVLNGRSALKLILIDIKKNKKFDKIYIPYFSCPSIKETFKEVKLRYEFYDFSFTKKNNIFFNKNKTNVILIIHYFGWFNEIANLNQKNLIKIEDFTHLFLQKKIIDQSSNSYVFASLRKYSHIKYGGWVNKRFKLETINKKIEKNIINFNKKLFLIKNKDNFQAEAEKFNYYIEKKYSSKKLSTILSKNLKTIDWNYIVRKRKKNWKFLSHKLDKLKNIKFINNKNNHFPLNFFLLHSKRNTLKNYLKKEKVFTSIHWKIKNNHKFVNSSNLSKQILSIPIDHRYNLKQMKHLANCIRFYDNNF